MDIDMIPGDKKSTSLREFASAFRVVKTKITYRREKNERRG